MNQKLVLFFRYMMNIIFLLISIVLNQSSWASTTDEKQVTYLLTNAQKEIVKFKISLSNNTLYLNDLQQNSMQLVAIANDVSLLLNSKINETIHPCFSGSLKKISGTLNKKKVETICLEDKQTSTLINSLKRVFLN